MMRHELFEVGSYDYSDLDDRLDKPVEWTEDDTKKESYSLKFLMNWIWKAKAYPLKLMSY